MTNFELHERAQQLADTTSAYELARRLVEMEQDRDQLRGCFHGACEELTALKAALVEPGEPVPIGPAVSLVKELKEERDSLQRLANNRAEQRDALLAHVERLHNALGPKMLDWIDCGMAANSRHKEAWARELRNELHQALAETPTTSLARLKAQCWKEAYLAGMEAGHHWTVEGGYVAGGDEEAAEDYVADRQAEEE